MDAHTAMDEWETTPFDGGLEEAADMARRGFSGALRSGTDWLFVADGEAVAVVSDLEADPSPGNVDAFEGASGEAHEAPHPAAARLAAMLALGGEVRGEYFSDDTPIGTVHDTLAEGGFTGYVELAENVLSGDYYVVFEDGEAEYVAFIGSTNRLATGEEAEEKTKHEVGIYGVTAVDLPDVELPDAPEPAGGAGAAGGVAAGSGTGDAGADTGDDPADDDGAVGIGAEAAEPVDADDDTDTATADEGDHGGLLDDEAGTSGTRDRAGGRDADATGTGDPGRGADAGGTADPAGTGDGGSSTDASDYELGSIVSDSETDTDTGTTAPPGADAAGPGSSDATVADLRGELEDLRRAHERLVDRVAALEAAGDGDVGAAARTDGPSLSPTEALSKTTLFVREGTRGGPTLEDAHDGRADRDALATNLELERHTRFDDAGATVDGQPYGAFLEASQAHEFVEWLTTDLLFEIRVTDSEPAMAHLYDAIPDIDRVFFQEAVTVGDGADQVEVTFDVVVRDRNGEPLFVAALDDSREPTPGARIEALVNDASDLCTAAPSVAGAFAVTASYFEPEALEVAREATTSSLLSREKYRSFVNLARKNGFHLCMVEAREASLHLTLPEL